MAVAHDNPGKDPWSSLSPLIWGLVVLHILAFAFWVRCSSPVLCLLYVCYMFACSIALTEIRFGTMHAVAFHTCASVSPDFIFVLPGCLSCRDTLRSASNPLSYGYRCSGPSLATLAASRWQSTEGFLHTKPPTHLTRALGPAALDGQYQTVAGAVGES